MSSPFPSDVRTERLRIERCSFETLDVRRLYEICSSDDGIDEVTRYLPWDPHETVHDTYSMVRTAESEWAAGETARYVVRPRSSEPDAGEIAGVSQLVPDWDRRSAMLGLWLRKKFWGRTYSAEHDPVLCEIAFRVLDLAVLELKANVDNGPSQRAIERLVDRFDGQLEGRLRNQVAYDDGEIASQYRYTIERDQWLDATDGGTRIIEASAPD